MSNPDLYVDREGRAVRTGRLVHTLPPERRAAVACAFIPQYATDRADLELEMVRGTGVFTTVRLYVQGVAYNAQTGQHMIVGWLTGKGDTVDLDLNRMVAYPLTVVRSIALA